MTTEQAKLPWHKVATDPVMQGVGRISQQAKNYLEQMPEEEHALRKGMLEQRTIEEALMAALMYDFPVECPKCGFSTNAWETEELKRLKPEMFTKANARFIFTAIVVLRETGHRCDFRTVEYTIKRIQPELYERFNMAAEFIYLREAFKDEALTYAHIKHWASLIHSLWQERQTPAKAERQGKPKSNKETQRTIQPIEMPSTTNT